MEDRFVGNETQLDVSKTWSVCLNYTACIYITLKKNLMHHESVELQNIIIVNVLSVSGAANTKNLVNICSCANLSHGFRFAFIHYNSSIQTYKKFSILGHQ